MTISGRQGVGPGTGSPSFEDFVAARSASLLRTAYLLTGRVVCRKISDCSAKFTLRFSSVLCLSGLPRLARVIRWPTFDARFSSVGRSSVR